MPYPLASRTRRFIAYCLDSVFYLLLIWPIELCLDAAQHYNLLPFMLTDNAEGALLVIALCTIWLIYFSAEGGPCQATWGKRLLGIKLERIDQECLGRYRAILRHLLHSALCLLMPLLIALWLYSVLLAVHHNLPYMLNCIIPAIVFLLMQVIYYTVLYDQESGAFPHDSVFCSRVVYGDGGRGDEGYGGVREE